MWFLKLEIKILNSTHCPKEIQELPVDNSYVDLFYITIYVNISLQLSRYLNRQYWEKVKEGSNAEPSAPVVHYDDGDDLVADGYNEPADNIVVGH